MNFVDRYNRPAQNLFNFNISFRRVEHIFAMVFETCETCCMLTQPI